MRSKYCDYFPFSLMSNDFRIVVESRQLRARAHALIDRHQSALGGKTGSETRKFAPKRNEQSTNDNFVVDGNKFSNVSLAARQRSVVSSRSTCTRGHFCLFFLNISRFISNREIVCHAMRHQHAHAHQATERKQKFRLLKGEKDKSKCILWRN